MQGAMFCALKAADQNRLGNNLPYPGAPAPGLAPTIIPSLVPNATLGSSSAPVPSIRVPYWISSEPVEQTMSNTAEEERAAAVLQAHAAPACSLADLHVGRCLARETFLAR